MPRFIIAGSVVGLGLFAIAAFIVGWFGLSSVFAALTFAALGVIVMVYVWDNYAMLYALAGRDVQQAVVDMKEVQARASSMLALEEAAQLCGLRYAEEKKLWVGQSHAWWFASVVAATMCIFLCAAITIKDGQFSHETWVLIGIAVLFISLAIRLFSGRHQLYCLDLGQGIFVRDDDDQLRLSDAWIEARCIDDYLPEADTNRRYEVVLCWPKESLELVLFILSNESDAQKYMTRMVQLTGAQVTKGRKIGDP